MKKLNKYLIGLFLIISIIGFSSCSNLNSNKNFEKKISLKKINLSNLKELKLKISDMTCEGCSSGVEAVIGGLNGVASAKVSYETGIGIVKYDPSIISIKEIVNVSNDLYPTKVFEN